MRHHSYLALAAGVAALFALPIANATAITYDFTGVVTSDSGFVNVTTGMAVTGSITLNYANGNSNQSTGVFASSSQDWSVVNEGGSHFGTAAPTLQQFVASFNVNIGADFSYGSASGLYSADSSIEGFAGSTTNDQLFIGEEHAADQTDDWLSAMDLLNGSNLNTPTWTGAGQPIYSATNINTGEISESSTDASGAIAQSTLQYTITSLTEAPAPVPLPATGWLVAAGVFVLGVAIRKRGPITAI